MNARIIGFFLLTLLPLISHADGWKAGAAAVNITPAQPMWMAGYGGRETPAEGKRTELFAKALVLDDADGNRGLILTMDLIGVDRSFSLQVTKSLQEKFQLSREQIALCASHTHGGPVVGENLAPLHYWSLDPEQKNLIEKYTVTLEEKLIEVTEQAIANLAPARLQYGSGKCTFAVNRRSNKPYSDVPELRSRGILEGPVDHDVPVLSIRNEDDAITAILFGYACHATVLSELDWNADYPGYAQTALEKAYPNAVALFWAGCGGDQNPLPRRTVELAEEYGGELAARVIDVLDAPMPNLAPALKTTFSEIALPLQKLPTPEDIAKSAKSPNRFEVARAKYLQRKIEEEGGLKNSYPYPIGIWKIGEQIDLVFLGGEVVVDYALRIKKEMRGTQTWVAGNANDVMGYIPSKRVLLEGGYEGGGSNVYYGLPSLWDESAEDLIVESVKGK